MSVGSGDTGRFASLYDAHGEKLRYLVVGGMNTVAGYLAFLATLAIARPLLEPLASSAQSATAWMGGHYYLVAQLAAWVLMVPFSTTTFKYLVFRSEGRWLPQVGKSYLVYAPAQGISSLTLWLAVRLLQLTPAVGQLIAVAVATVFSYTGHKYFTFRAPAKNEGPASVAERLDG